MLKTVPFEKIDFRILLVECKQPPLLREIILYLDSKGYQNTTRAKNDVIFIKKRRKNTLRILHECSCFIEFIKRVGEKR